MCTPRICSPTAKTLMPRLFSLSAGCSASSWDLPSVMRMQICRAMSLSPTDPLHPSGMSQMQLPTPYLWDPRPELCGTKEVVRDVAQPSAGPCVAALVAQLLDGPLDACAIGVLGEAKLHPGDIGTHGDT